MTGPERPRPFAELRVLPPELRVSGVVVAALCLALAAGLALGFFAPAHHVAQRALSMTFYTAAFLYFVISVVDFREHFLLEEQLTGRRLAWSAVPVGETVNHLCSATIIALAFTLPRPIASIDSMTARDFVAVSLPLAFLAFGLRDEMVFHRRRAVHREDLMHTTAHLCAGAMFAAWMPLRLIEWRAFESAAASAAAVVTP